MGWGVEGLNAIARHVADWPQAAILVPSLPGASLWLLTVGGLWLCLWRRRWRLAGLPVAVAGLLLGPPPPPDLLMSEDGRVLGLRDEQGHGPYRLGPHRPLRQRRLGAAQRPGGRQALDGRAPTSRPPASAASTGLCRWRKGPWRIALVSDDRRLAEACGSADIVLSTVDAQGRCRGPRLVIDRRDAWREGAQALWLDETGRAARDRQRPARRPALGAQQLDAAGRAGEGAGRLTDYAAIAASSADARWHCLALPQDQGSDHGGNLSVTVFVRIAFGLGGIQRRP